MTGFDPFGKERFNPSAWAVRQLRDDELGGVQLLRVVLPTSYRRAELGILDLLKRYKPAAVVCFGLASRRAKIGIEAVALNADHADDPDNDGKKRIARKIAPRGPWVYETRLPVDRLLRALQRAGIPAAVSYQAGTFVCNHVFYVLMHSLRNRAIPAGFVHVPPIRRLLRKGLTEKQLLAGVRAILTQVGRELK